MDLYTEIGELRARGVPCALASVIGTRGSTPGRDAMKMLVRADGSTRGTVGGGQMEESVRVLALEAMRTETCQRGEYELSTEAVDDSELICGGTVEVFVEPLTIPTCVLFGAGHLARAIAVVADTAGFRVVVADDRATHASAARFPTAGEVHAAPFADLFTSLTPTFGDGTYCVLVTRSHQLDEECAAACLRSGARYVGMIGSKKKVKACHDALREAGLSEDEIGRLKAPVGLDLGAQTHGEIAVSIVAELVLERRAAQGGDGSSKSL